MKPHADPSKTTDSSRRSRTLLLTFLFASATAAADPGDPGDPGDPDDPDDLVLDRPTLVDRGWLAMQRCTGAAPPQIQGFAYTTVDEVEGRSGYAGSTWVDPADGRVRIVVKEGDEDPLVLLHELAHHWIGWTPRALREGLSDLLAECAYRDLTGDASFELDDLTDRGVRSRIFAWTTDEALSDDEIGQRYRDAYLLARVLSGLLPADELWAPTGGGGWPELWLAVGRHRDLAITWEAPDPSDPDVQGWPRMGVADPAFGWAIAPLVPSIAAEDVDGDGMRAADEAAYGANPLMWDTDGDGFWDGADPPAGAFAVPAEDACVGIAPQDGAWTLAFGGPDQDATTPSEIPFEATAGTQLVVEGVDRRRVWGAVTGPAIDPCDPELPATAGAWPMSVLDADRDGVVRFDERDAGTDPDRYDTDGDGFWDGAEPPPGAVPVGSPGLRCLAWPRRAHPVFDWVGVGGPDEDQVKVSLLAIGNDGGETRLALFTVGGPRSQAWISGLPEGHEPCAGFVPVLPGRQCVGTARDGRPVRTWLYGPERGSVTVVPYVHRVARGDPLYVDATTEPEFTGNAWLVPNRRLDPCPPAE